MYIYLWISIGPLAELKYQLNTFFWSIFTLKSCSNYIAMDKNGQVFLDTQQGLIYDSYEKILLNPLIILIFWCRGGGGGVAAAGLKRSAQYNLFIQKIKNQHLHFEYCTKDSSEINSKRAFYPFFTKIFTWFYEGPNNL